MVPFLSLELTQYLSGSGICTQASVVESLIYTRKSSHSPSISVHQDIKPLVDPEEEFLYHSWFNLSHVMYFSVNLDKM